MASPATSDSACRATANTCTPRVEHQRTLGAALSRRAGMGTGCAAAMCAACHSAQVRRRARGSPAPHLAPEEAPHLQHEDAVHHLVQRRGDACAVVQFQRGLHREGGQRRGGARGGDAQRRGQVRRHALLCATPAAAAQAKGHVLGTGGVAGSQEQIASPALRQAFTSPSLHPCCAANKRPPHLLLASAGPSPLSCPLPPELLVSPMRRGLRAGERSRGCLVGDAERLLLRRSPLNSLEDFLPGEAADRDSRRKSRCNSRSDGRVGITLASQQRQARHLVQLEFSPAMLTRQRGARRLPDGKSMAILLLRQLLAVYAAGAAAVTAGFRLLLRWIPAHRATHAEADLVCPVKKPAAQQQEWRTFEKPGNWMPAAIIECHPACLLTCPSLA